MARTNTSQISEVYVGRLFGLPVFDPIGDQVGKLKDVVLILGDSLTCRAVGFVVEIRARRNIFISLSKVLSITSDQIIASGLVNVRAFQKRNIETLAYSEFFDRIIKVRGLKEKYAVDDFSIIKRGNEWLINKLYVHETDGKNKERRLKGLFVKPKETRFVDMKDVILPNILKHDSATAIVGRLEDMKPADVADLILDLDKKRQVDVAKELDNERLADVLEEMPEASQVQILDEFEQERVADVLEEMEPDDAADLLGHMGEDEAKELLEEMDPEDAEDVRDLMQYDDKSAGGLMTTNAVILSGDSTVADALAQIRRPELPQSLASLVFVCKSPLEPPTGPILGVLYFQQLLRYPPHMRLDEIVDLDYHYCEANDSLDKIARLFATYDAFMIPVLDDDKRLLGAISIDDLIDHMLPEDWREVED
ncbi:MAG: CBS domain-containing protein [Candidatus Ancillula sp.]|jgi:flagellar motility protein MotE (MotC chaperone)/sporulation protein YlmC with PRC-barrel domain|nr:CBS domain-containing protein [Candidatus Ancillula sp.]